jgi:copper chaperone CopZ
MQQLTMAIQGMSCGHCSDKVRRALAGLEGVRVEHVEVGSATVAYEPAIASPERIVGAIAALGYGASWPGTDP